MILALTPALARVPVPARLLLLVLVIAAVAGLVAIHGAGGHLAMSYDGTRSSMYYD